MKILMGMKNYGTRSNVSVEEDTWMEQIIYILCKYLKTKYI